MAFSSLTNTHHPTIQLYFFQEELKIIKILRHICPREEVNRSKLNSTRSTISNFFSTRPSPCFQNLSSVHICRPFDSRRDGSRCPSSFRDEESKDPRVIYSLPVTRLDKCHETRHRSLLPPPSPFSQDPLVASSPDEVQRTRDDDVIPPCWEFIIWLSVCPTTPLCFLCIATRSLLLHSSLVPFRFQRGRIVSRGPRGWSSRVVHRLSFSLHACINFPTWYQDTGRRSWFYTVADSRFVEFPFSLFFGILENLEGRGG